MYMFTTKSTLSLIGVFAGLLLAATPSVFAQHANLTLSQAVQETRDNSLVIQKASSALEEAKWRKVESTSGYLPTLSGSVSYLTDKRYGLVDVNFNGVPVTMPQIVPTSQYTLSARLPIFDGFASTNKYRAATALRESSENEFDWTIFAIERQTVLIFYKTLAAQTLNLVAEQNLKTFQDHLKDVEAYKKAGLSTRYDVLRIEVQVSEAETELINTNDNVEIAKLKLAEVLGKETEPRTLAGALPALSEKNIKDLTALNIGARKDLAALERRSEAAHFNYSAANRFWVPRISLFADYQYYNNRNDRFDDSTGYRDSYMMGVNLAWNIFDGMTSIARSAQADEQAIQGEKNLRISQIKAKQDFEFWKRKYIYFCRVFKSRQNDVKKSEEAVRLSKEGHKVGARTSTDMLDVELDLFRSRAGQINAQIGAIEALINLELASGQKLFDFTAEVPL